MDRHFTHPYWSIKTDKIVCLENMTAYICMNCGDNVCGEEENWCVCPEDCPKPKAEDLETTNIVPQ